MSTFDVAGAAIEEIVARHHPQDSGNWATIEPTSTTNGWGLTKARWSTEARQIVTAFRNGIAPRTISVPNTAIEHAGKKPLDEFQDYLAVKADYEN